MAGHEKPEVDQATNTETTGHEWDGIKELNTPLPRWWLWTFYATIVWALIYTILFPAWPLLTTATAGVLGYTNRGALHAAVAEATEARRAFTDRIAAMDITEVANDAELHQFSLAGGAAVFRNHCSQCHGAGAAGVQAAGYPNLRDDEWLWGGTLEDIRYTVAHGIRNQQDDAARYSEMPAFGAMDILTRAEIEAVADHVLSFSGAAQSTEEGATLYADNCAACHGDAGEGMPEMGAPNLADAIWLYGGDRDTVIETITYSRFGVMPAWSGRLSEADITQVALYIHSLGGGQ
jgi:cytochrome c oxidase cbb3-type subunit 3